MREKERQSGNVGVSLGLFERERETVWECGSESGIVRERRRDNLGMLE